MKLAAHLSYLFELQHYRLVDLARTSGIPASDLSNIVKGRRTCGDRNLVKLVSGLKEEHRSQAVALWVWDQIPDELKHYVHVVRASDPSAPKEAPMPPDVNTLDGALEILRREAEHNSPILKVLMNLAASFNRV